MNAKQIADAVKKAHAEQGADAPLRLDLTAEENRSIQAVMDILPKGWKCLATQHLDPRLKKMFRAVFLSPKYQPPKPIAVIEAEPGKGEDVKAAIDRAERKARTEHGEGFHFHTCTEHVFTPRPGVFHRVEVWTHEAWAAHKCACFTLAEIVSLLTETHLVISRTERRKEKGRTVGATNTKNGATKRTALIRREFSKFRATFPKLKKWQIEEKIAEKHPKTYGFKIRSIQKATAGLK